MAASASWARLPLVTARRGWCAAKRGTCIASTLAPQARQLGDSSLRRRPSPCVDRTWQECRGWQQHHGHRGAVATVRSASNAAGQLEDSEGLLPVMLLSGFLGAGKTTTLKHVLANQEGLRVAVIVNDMADINIDERMLKGSTIHDASLVELSNGCMCCSLRADLMTIITDLASRKAFDLLIVEGTGIALPMPVAASFAYEDDDGRCLGDVSYLDTITTVVDAPRFLSDVMEARDLQEVGMEEYQHDTRVVSEILVEQVEFADMLLVNKADCLSESELSQVTAFLRELNPKAKVLTSEYGRVPVSELVLTRRFDLEAMSEAAGWVEKLNDLAAAGVSRGSADSHSHSHGHHHEHNNGETHGISSFVFTSDRPFHPARLAEELESPWDGLLRSKGFFWVATRHNTRGLWQTAGQSWSGEFSGLWEAVLPEEERHAEDGDQEAWHPVWGDRMQELVFIGINMDQAALTERLTRCLLSEEEMEMGPQAWAQLEDPLPGWDVEYETA